MFSLLSELERYLPTHPRSHIPSLIGGLVVFVIFWAIFRLALRVIFARFLHAHLSIGHVGWSSLNDVEWSLVRHARGTTSARIQRVYIKRISLTFRGRGAKDNDIGLAWLGIAIKGVTVSMCLVPSRDSDADLRSPASPNSSISFSSEHLNSHISPPQSAFQPTPAPNSLSFSKNATLNSSHSSTSATSTIHRFFTFLVYTVRTIHEIRRRLRRIILRSIPETQQRKLLRRIGRITRFLRHRLVAPLLTLINSWGRACNKLTTFLALEVSDITIEASQINTELKVGLARFGAEMVRRPKSYVGLWARLEQINLVVQNNVAGERLQSKAAASQPITAFAISGPLLIEAQANFDPSIGMAGLYHRDASGALEPRKTILDLSFAFLRSSSTFGKDEKVIETTTGGPLGSTIPSSIKLQLNSLLELSERVKMTMDPRPEPHFGPHMGLHLHSRDLHRHNDNFPRASTPYSRTNSEADSWYTAERPSFLFHKDPRNIEPIPARRNPASMLRSITISIPLVKVEATLPKLSASDRSRTRVDTPSQMAVEIKLRGFAAEVAIAKPIMQDDKHLHWFGKHENLKLAARAGFEKFDVDIASGIPHSPSFTKSSRVLDISPSGVHISSTYLPPRMNALFAEPVHQPGLQDESEINLNASSWGRPTEPASLQHKSSLTDERDSSDRSSGLIVLEADIGGVNGEATLEIIQGLLLTAAVQKSRSQADSRARLAEQERDSEEESVSSIRPWHMLSPPAVAVVFEFGRCGYRIVGPDRPHRTSFGPGEDDAELSSGFGAPSILCVHISSLAAVLHTRYADVPVHRSAAQRREHKQEIRRGSVNVPSVLFSGMQSQRASELRAQELRKKMFDSPRLNEDDEEFSQSTSPTSPAEHSENRTSFAYSSTAANVPFPTYAAKSNNNQPAAVPLTTSGIYREHDVLCFITPDDGRMPEYARRIAVSHSGASKVVAEHPFVYFVASSITCHKIDVYLLSSHDEGRRGDLRSNPTSAPSDRSGRGSNASRTRATSQSSPKGHARRPSRPVLPKRHDIFTIGQVDVEANLEVMGRESPASESVFDDIAVLSWVNADDAHGSVTFVNDGFKADIPNAEVHHCLSALTHLITSIPIEEALPVPTDHLDSGIAAGGISTDTTDGHLKSTLHADSATALRPPKHIPLAEKLPPNIHFSAAFAHVELVIAGPDPKHMPSECRGLSLRISQITLQHYRQDRHIASLTHAHIRAPLGLSPDLRAHAHAIFAVSETPQQAFASLHIRQIKLNPVKGTYKETRLLRPEVPFNVYGRHTTADVETISLKTARWCNLPRHHFFPKAKEPAPGAQPKPQHKRGTAHKSQAKANETVYTRTRDFFYIPQVDTKITMWTRPVDDEVTSAGGDSRSRYPSSTSYTPSTVNVEMRDCFGVVIRIPEITMHVELLQVYCFLLAFSAARSLIPKKERPAVQDGPSRPRPYLQLKCTAPQLHLYWTLPHEVKLYIGIRRIDISTYNNDLHVSFDSAIVAGESHICKGMWEDFVKVRRWTLIMKKEPENAGFGNHIIILKGEGGRLRIPCKYPASEIVDNLVTFVKLTKQLSHQFVKGKYGSAIEPRAEGPKHIPEIRISLGILVFEAADDPFEAKLNLIWNASKLEQKARLRRQALFDEKLRVLQEQEQLERAAARLRPQSGSGDVASIYGSAVQEQFTPETQRKRASLEHAQRRLDRFNSDSWRKVYKDTLGNRIRYEEAQLKRLYGNMIVWDDEAPVQLLAHIGQTPLVRFVCSSVDFVLSRPHFDQRPDGLVEFLADVGKGIPRETEYSLLIPFHLDWRMDEVKVHVRDYPIPLLDVPAFVNDEKDQDDRTRSWHLATDFVIAEELSDHTGVRRVPATIVPADHKAPRGHTEGYYFLVPRTAMPVKFYALPVITIKSDLATRLSWGNSVQPAIQDIMRVLDSLSKTPPDPSERLGFWDKIRLILHWRIEINFAGKGPLHLILKGSRDPYKVQRFGAGFALSWHGDIKWRIGFDNEDREFFQILSDRFVLGVPDLKDYVAMVSSGRMHERPKAIGDGDDVLHSMTPLYEGSSADQREQKLSKVCAKFQGGVKWGLGMKFERTCRDDTCHKGCQGTLFQRQCRIFDFRPHYTVRTISKNDAVGIDLKNHDSYAGFRSDFIHFSISVIANKPDSPANTLHLTPNGFTHFWAWWHLFDGTLGLPVRHGPVFDNSLPPSKKFGKHCATIKYRIQLAPVFIAHTYKQDIPGDTRKGHSTVLGVKGRMEAFNVDMHQREQEERVRKPNTDDIKVALHKAFHRVEVDCSKMDLRVISARFSCGTTVSENPHEDESENENPEIDLLDMDSAVPLSSEEAVWIDDDDFEDQYTPLGERLPNVHLISCLKTPRLTYSRYAQHNQLHPPIRSKQNTESTSGHEEQERSNTTVESDSLAKGPISKFGQELTHTCLLNNVADAIDVQISVMQERLLDLEQELSSVRHDPKTTHKELEELQARCGAAKMSILRFENYRDRKASANSMPEGVQKSAAESEYMDDLREKEHIPDFDVFEDLDTWINRLMIHNPNVVISQRIRDILLRYYYSSRQRRFFNYAMTAQAIKFIRELAKDHQKATFSPETNGQTPANKLKRDVPREPEIVDLLENLLQEVTGAKPATGAHQHAPGSAANNSRIDVREEPDPIIQLREQLSPNERSQNSFLISVLKPQVCLSSELGGHSSTVIIASQAVQLRICAVVDIDHVDDPINANVMHRSYGRVDALQAFYPHLRGWRSGVKETVMGRVNTFIPLEVLAGLTRDTRDLDTIVPPTNAQVIYDKNNRLRLLHHSDRRSNNKESGLDHTVDHFKVICDRFTVNATSTHFGAIYDVVTNLVLYSDPGQKARTQKIEQLVLSKDFSDTLDIARNIERQQGELRQFRSRLIEAMDDSCNFVDTSTEARGEMMAFLVEYIRRKDILTLWLGAIQASQSSRSSGKSMGLQLDARAKEIVWHMREGDGKPLAKFSVQDVYFCWQNRSDGGVSNSLVIRDLTALNSGVDPYFSEIIAKHPYPPTAMETRFMKADIFIAVIWSMLSPVGGISIVDHFQVHLHPIRLQMEQAMADKLKQYIFSQRDAKYAEDTSSIASGHTGSPLSSKSTPPLSDASSISSYGSGRLSAAMRSTDNLSLDSRNSKRPASIHADNKLGILSLPGLTGSQVSLNSKPITSRPRSILHSHTVDTALGEITRDDHLDAEEMRERARLNRTFLHVELFPTILCLSFKGDKSTTLPDVYGLIYKSPTIIHCNRIWTYLDLLEHIKKDFTSSIWSQSATLIGQLLTTARKPKNVMQQHMQRSLLSHGPERGSSDRDRRKSFTSSIRSRLSSVGPEDTKSSPLRASHMTEHADEQHSDSDSSHSI